MSKVPVLDENKAPESGSYYVMECTLTVQRTETMGSLTTERVAELNGYLSKEVLESALAMMSEVLE